MTTDQAVTITTSVSELDAWKSVKSTLFEGNLSYDASLSLQRLFCKSMDTRWTVVDASVVIDGYGDEEMTVDSLSDKLADYCSLGRVSKLHFFATVGTETAAPVVPVVEVDVAEIMVAEAIQIGEEQLSRQSASTHAAEVRARAAEERVEDAEELPEQPSCWHDSLRTASISKQLCSSEQRSVVHAKQTLRGVQWRRCWQKSCSLSRSS